MSILSRRLDPQRRIKSKRRALAMCPGTLAGYPALREQALALLFSCNPRCAGADLDTVLREARSSTPAGPGFFLLIYRQFPIHLKAGLCIPPHTRRR
jgi:hypothetical protein